MAGERPTPLPVGSGETAGTNNGSPLLSLPTVQGGARKAVADTIGRESAGARVASSSHAADGEDVALVRADREARSGGHVTGDLPRGSRLVDVLRAARTQGYPSSFTLPEMLREVFPVDLGAHHTFAAVIGFRGKRAILVRMAAEDGWQSARLRMVDTATGVIQVVSVDAERVWHAARRVRNVGAALWREVCAEAWGAQESERVQAKHSRERAEQSGRAVLGTLRRSQWKKEASQHWELQLGVVKRERAAANADNLRFADDDRLYARLLLQALHPDTAYEMPLQAAGGEGIAPVGMVRTQMLAGDPGDAGSRGPRVRLTTTHAATGRVEAFEITAREAALAALQAHVFGKAVFAAIARDRTLLEPPREAIPRPHPICEPLSEWIAQHGRPLRRILRATTSRADDVAREGDAVRRVLTPASSLRRHRHLLLVPQSQPRRGSAAASRSSDVSHVAAVLGGLGGGGVGSFVVELDATTGGVGACTGGPRVTIRALPLPSTDRKGRAARSPPVVQVSARAFARACLGAVGESPAERLRRGVDLCLSLGGRPAPRMPWRCSLTAKRLPVPGAGQCVVSCTVDERQRRLEMHVERLDCALDAPLLAYRVCYIPFASLADKTPAVLMRRGQRRDLARAVARSLVAVPSGGGMARVPVWAPASDGMEEAGGGRSRGPGVSEWAPALSAARFGQEAAAVAATVTEDIEKGALPRVMRRRAGDSGTRAAPATHCRRDKAAASVLGAPLRAGRNGNVTTAAMQYQARKNANAAAARLQHAVLRMRGAPSAADHPPTAHLELLARRGLHLPGLGRCVLQLFSGRQRQAVLVTCIVVAPDEPKGQPAGTVLYRVWPVSQVVPQGRPLTAPLGASALGRVEASLPCLAPRLRLCEPGSILARRRVLLMGVVEAEVTVQVARKGEEVRVVAARSIAPTFRAAVAAPAGEVLPAQLLQAVKLGGGRTSAARHVLSNLVLVRTDAGTASAAPWRLFLPPTCDLDARREAQRAALLILRRQTQVGREWAAVRIQSAFRGHDARQGLRELESASVALQSAYRGHRMRAKHRQEVHAARRIQQLARSRQVRIQARAKERAAMVLQRSLRGAVARMIERKRSDAATLLSRWIRGSLGRKAASRRVPRIMDRAVYVRGAGLCRVRAYVDRARDEVLFFALPLPRGGATLRDSSAPTPPHGSGSVSPQPAGALLTLRHKLAELRAKLPMLHSGTRFEKQVVSYMAKNLDASFASLTLRNEALRLLSSRIAGASEMGGNAPAAAGLSGIGGGSIDGGGGGGGGDSGSDLLGRIVAQGYLDEAKARARRARVPLDATAKARRLKFHLQRTHQIYSTPVKGPSAGPGRLMHHRLLSSARSPGWPLPRPVADEQEMGLLAEGESGLSRRGEHDGSGGANQRRTLRPASAGQLSRPASQRRQWPGSSRGRRSLHTQAPLQPSPLKAKGARTYHPDLTPRRDGWLQLDPERVHRLETNSYREMVRERRRRRQQRREQRRSGHDGNSGLLGHMSSAPILPPLSPPAEWNGARGPLPSVRGSRHTPASAPACRVSKPASLIELEAAMSLPHSVPVKELMLLVRARD